MGDPLPHLRWTSLAMAASYLLLLLVTLPLKLAYGMRLPSMIGGTVHGVFFTSHCASGTLGKAVIKSRQGDLLDVDGTPVMRQCRIEEFHFTSHSTRDELLDMLGRLSPAKAVLLPGRKDSRERLAREMAISLPSITCLLPEPGEEIPLVD